MTSEDVAVAITLKLIGLVLLLVGIAVYQWVHWTRVKRERRRELLRRLNAR